MRSYNKKEKGNHALYKGFSKELGLNSNYATNLMVKTDFD